MIQFDEHIFEMGWFNHQPENISGYQVERETFNPEKRGSTAYDFVISMWFLVRHNLEKSATWVGTKVRYLSYWELAVPKKLR